jgi:hypothetical protein
MYYDNIAAQQEAKLRGGFDTVLKVLWRSTFGGDVPKDLEFKFTPLWQMTAMDKANIAKTNAETILGAYEGGLTSRESALKELRDSSADTGIFSNITDEEIEEAANDEPPMPDEAPLPSGDPAAPDPITNPATTPVKSLGSSKSADAKPVRLEKVLKWFSRR